MASSPGAKFRELLKAHQPLQIVGTINAFTALLAEKAGHQAIYLSGAGVANASFGLPDLGITTLDNVLEDARRITSVSSLPLLVDIDTGFGESFNIARCIQQMIKADVAGVHMEDQISQKRCGHRPNKQIVSCSEMVDRIKAAVDAKTDPNFFIIARTDAFANEGLDAALERSQAYLDAGADGIFAEALKRLDDFKAFSDHLKVPILANMTEFGKTPLFHVDELKSVGCSMALYPLSAFRAMSLAALQTYESILNNGVQSSQLDKMQTREELYDILNYHDYEKKLDQLFKQS